MVRQTHACLREVVAAVPEEEWGRPTPCSKWTVRQVLNRARIDQQAYGLALRAGRPADALHGDPVAEPDKVLDAVADAYAGLPADAGSVPTPLGPLPLPPVRARWTPQCTPGTSPSPPFRSGHSHRRRRRTCGRAPTSWRHGCASTACSLPPSPATAPRTRRRPSSPSSAATRSGRRRRPDRGARWGLWGLHIRDLRTLRSPARDRRSGLGRPAASAPPVPPGRRTFALVRGQDVLIHLYRVVAARLRDR